MNTFIVNTTTEDTDNDNNILSLREAIHLANSTFGTDIIEFDDSLAGSSIFLTDGKLAITESVTINGLGADLLTIDAQNNSSVFDIDNRNGWAIVEISGLTITGGSALPAGAGGGIHNKEYLILRDSNISGNSAYYGGGISNDELAILINTTISDNSARDGGGIYNSRNRSAEMFILNSTLSDNSASYGGGIFNEGGTYYSGKITLTNSTLSRNSANSSGGGIYNSGRMALTNSTLSSNSTNSVGGGIFNGREFFNDLHDGSARMSLINSTLTGNVAPLAGGGIFNSTPSGSATVTMTNTLIAGNEANIGNEIVNDYSGTISADSNNFFGHAGLIHADAFFNFIPGASDFVATADATSPATQYYLYFLADILEPLADNGGPTQTHALAPGSPAVDAGRKVTDTTDVDDDEDTEEILPVDQRGLARNDGNIDIGAFEECFLTGTRILTDQGEVPVEELQIGDLVQTTDGELQPVKWVGHQTREPGQIRNPLRGYPIQIKTGALGNGLPHRDLFVSPDHALLFEGLLINAGALVNGTSICKTIPTNTFVYHHIELAQHSLLVAEGTAAESYLPQKEDRPAYDNSDEYLDLYPHNGILCYWPMNYPRVSSVRQLPRYIRKQLDKIAQTLDSTTAEVA